MQARVATAGEVVACEREVIDSGKSAWTLMRAAGELSAALIERRFASRLNEGIAVYAGSGNNGGDAWVAARGLAQAGVLCRVASSGEPRTEESRRAREEALTAGAREEAPLGTEALVVDGLLGTGATGLPRGSVASCVAAIGDQRRSGARVVALDLPSGLDATTGDHEGAVEADMTVTFGMMKRGHLLARDICGEIFAADIGLECSSSSGLPMLVDTSWVAARVPRIPFSAHKGSRKTLAIVGGGKGMAGAAILAGDGALHAGIGIVRIFVAEGNELPVHAGLPAAIVGTWPRSASDLEETLRGMDSVAIGPGLGKGAAARDLVERVLLAWTGPVVVDADAVNVFEKDMLSLAGLLKGRAAVITPHPAELARLAGKTTEEVVRNRFDVGLAVAAELGAAVLLKGAPTVVFCPSGKRFVVAAGSAALATGGSGDVLTGMTGTLLAQMTGSASEAAACAAFVHGRAAELTGAVRGVTLADVLDAMPRAWANQPDELPDGVIAHLGRVS
jgi:hydroxyethylthiazole kinase-like uncharacterized protein yjeF